MEKLIILGILFISVVIFSRAMARDVNKKTISFFKSLRIGFYVTMLYWALSTPSVVGIAITGLVIFIVIVSTISIKGN